MNQKEYLEHFETIVNTATPQAPYDDPEMMHYTKMNLVRLNRWLKTSKFSSKTNNIFSKINKKQKWVLISEPWCGDAAHITPIIFQLSELNKNIELDIQLRDDNSEIDKYLTNGGKAIPILIIRDENGKDLAVWGPRPKGAQKLFLELKDQNASYEDIKTEVQAWYNKDKAEMIQNEISDIIESLNKN